MKGISRLADKLLSSQGGLYSMGLVSYLVTQLRSYLTSKSVNYEGWNFNSGNYLFTTDTK